MSQRTSEIVRQRLVLKDRPRRGLDERIFLFFPSVVRFVAAAVFRLPPRSRLRHAVLRRVAQIGFDATNRKDFASGFLLYHPDCELVTPRIFVALGFDPVYHGRQARLEFQRSWSAEWGEVRFEPVEVLDLGERLLFLGGVKGSGVSSGAAVESDWGVLFTLSAGRLIREQPFFDRQEALEAAGLRE